MATMARALDRRTTAACGAGGGTARRRGHTMMEVLVSLGIFAFLGTALITLLNQGVSVYRIADTRGRIYERARAILETVADDLRGAATDVAPEGSGFWVRFVSDADAAGQQRVRFTRALAGESSDPIGRHGGEYLERSDGGHFDHHSDAIEIEEGRLLAPGGYQEVLYVLDPEAGAATLWRGVRAPVGGVGSFFIDANVEPAPAAGAAGSSKPAGGGAAAGAAESSEASRRRELLQRIARPLAGDVLHFGLRFWAPTTTTWDPAAPPLRSPKAGEASGAVQLWDSTRAMLDAPGARPEHFGWPRRDASLGDPTDDIFPERIEITLVLRDNPEVGDVRLPRAVSATESSIPISDTSGFPEAGEFRYAYIDGEWIGYEKIEGGRLIVARNGRGARGTRAATHPAGARVEVGTSFRRVVELPAWRLPFSRLDRDDSGRMRGRYR